MRSATAYNEFELTFDVHYARRIMALAVSTGPNLQRASGMALIHSDYNPFTLVRSRIKRQRSVGSRSRLPGYIQRSDPASEDTASQ